MQTHSIQPHNVRTEIVQRQIAGYAGGRSESVCSANYLTPLKLAGQRPAFAPEVFDLIKAIKKEFATEQVREIITGSIDLIEGLYDAGFVHTPDLLKLHKAAQGANLKHLNGSLKTLINTAVSNLKHDIFDHVQSTLGSIAGLAGFIEKVFAADEVYTLSVDDSSRSSPNKVQPLKLKLSATVFMDIRFLGLPLNGGGHGQELTPFLWNTISLLLRRGGGISCSDVFSYARGYYVGDVSKKVTTWLRNTISEIECLPSDEPVSHLFDFDCPELRKFWEELTGESWLFEDAETVDDVDRDELLNMLSDASNSVEALKVHEPYTKGAPTELEELLAVQWPEHPVADLFKNLLAQHSNAPEFDNTSLVADEDMLYPFSFILHPCQSVYTDGQEEILDGIYQESMNVGEGFESYEIDVKNAQWLLELKSFITATCATLLACTIIAENQK